MTVNTVQPRFGLITVLNPTRTRQLQTYLNETARGALNRPNMVDQLSQERAQVGGHRDDAFRTAAFHARSRESTGVWPYISDLSEAGLFPLGEDGWSAVVTNHWASKIDLSRWGRRPYPHDTMNHLLFALREDPRAFNHPGQVVAEFVGNERRDHAKLEAHPIVDLIA
ncbi:MAG: hypothetical protein KC476_04915 [Cyanobacteria bacterium HKST-UBA06]|nr:hypothetical protein [Cyanobacteria bacterium HKST-UBA04]MCA9807278.1 hypothetical protein [Cyanobacteria bacterium HKST-UBA06]MCA9840631.1 hypothetical protein [Cyanobacteria bacterium HKST-UBA03]